MARSRVAFSRGDSLRIGGDDAPRFWLAGVLLILHNHSPSTSGAVLHVLGPEVDRRGRCLLVLHRERQGLARGRVIRSTPAVRCLDVAPSPSFPLVDLWTLPGGVTDPQMRVGLAPPPHRVRWAQHLAGLLRHSTTSTTSPVTGGGLPGPVSAQSDAIHAELAAAGRRAGLLPKLQPPRTVCLTSRGTASIGDAPGPPIPTLMPDGPPQTRSARKLRPCLASPRT